MTSASLVLKVYYERLYELMEARRPEMLSRVDELLSAEVARQRFGDMGADKLAAYREACVAFIDERLESWNSSLTGTTADPSSRISSPPRDLLPARACRMTCWRRSPAN